MPWIAIYQEITPTVEIYIQAYRYGSDKRRPDTPPHLHPPQAGRIFIGRGEAVEASQAQQWDGSTGGEQPEQATSAGGLYP
jgi:hypothetical protein